MEWNETRIKLYWTTGLDHETIKLLKRKLILIKL